MNGARRIFSYNWPIYAATWIGAVVTAIVVPRVVILAGLAIAWSVVSLLVSHWVYDRSALVAGTWIAALLPDRVGRWATVDTGLDAEVDLDAVMPGTCVSRLDLFDGNVVRAPSVQRARALTPRTHAATAALATALPLADASLDVITVVFTAHEVRRVADRESFFTELQRSLRVGGRVILVEHVRDLANFAAFGPGYLHFQSRAEWVRLAALVNLSIAVETRVTPFVMAMALERRA